MDAHLRDLRYFVAVAEELSFTRAAERLYLSQPALSKQIRNLEGTLRVQLLERDRRRVALTDAGKVLLSVAQQMLKEWDDGVVAATEAAAAEARVLRLGILTSITRSLYPEMVAQFSQHQPDWQIELTSFGWGDATAGLRDRASDAALVWLPVETEDLAYEVLVDEPRFVALGSRHPLAARQSVSFTDIADEPFVALPPEAGPLRDFWLAMAERDGEPPRIAAEAATVDEKLEIVAAGTSVALLAEGMTATYRRPDVTFLPVSGLAPAQFAVAWRGEDQREVVQDFVLACREAAQSRTAL